MAAIVTDLKADARRRITMYISPQKAEMADRIVALAKLKVSFGPSWPD
jgi:hypothetical protein